MFKNLLLSGWFRIQPFLKYCAIVILVSPIVISVPSTLAGQSELAENTSGTTQTADSQAKLPLKSSNLNHPSGKIPVTNPVTSPLSQVPQFGSPKEAKASATPLTTEIPIEEIPGESQGTPEDPVGSPHPIPWNWILLTQTNIGGKGFSAIRQYRSFPVTSPDGRYAIYSRVQMEVKPEMYNSRVTSILFIEDTHTRRLKVLTATSPLRDLLLRRQPILSELSSISGSIKILVPVSWSGKGDRFLARQFVGKFNTGDVTDYAVIWDRDQNQINTIAPSDSENDHDRIAILLGWSKKHPNSVLFRVGELGAEDWPILAVSSDGKTTSAALDQDHPVTFGQRNAQIWIQPQVAYK